MTTIGVIGIGRMGRAIAERLADQGHALVLWNRSREKARGLPGSEIADFPSDVAARARIVIVMLSGEAAIETVYRGTGGVCSIDLTGVTVVDMSTTLPEATQKLEQEVISRGGQFLECPVGGTVGPARNGELLGLAGGDDAAFEAARPMLETLCRRLEHLGPVGTGAAMKLAVNLPLMVYWSAIGEAVGLALAAGIPAERAFDILADSSGAIAAAKRRVPALCALVTSGRAGEPMFDLKNGIKDMTLMEILARRFDVPAPTIAAARAKAESAQDAGWEGYDTSLYGMHAIRRAGLC